MNQILNQNVFLILLILVYFEMIDMDLHMNNIHGIINLLHY